MRRGFALIWTFVTVLIAGISAWIAYGAGLAAGLATKVPDGTAYPYPGPYYGYGWHPLGFGFGIFGFLFTLFVLFVIFRVIFFAGWRGRRFGGRHGRFEEWHRQMHETPTPPPTATTV